jgi:1L-myo-inositol 1-phosphate cytidylyltransferase / CDP-L-myo-inositol myo-inositolphosphotransferase
MDVCTLPRPAGIFPLARHASFLLTPWLARTGVTPNVVTLVSVALGLAAAASVLGASYARGIVGALLLVASYVLDNCDGELARLRNRASDFGRFLDMFGGWLVHAALFASLGLAVSARTGQEFWSWLGWLAVAGGTLDYLAQEVKARLRPAEYAASPAAARRPGTWREHLLYAFRELSRADFCFLVLLLALVDGLWVLLPMGAVGAQIYWLSNLVKGAHRFHA